jgi:hypothetical protein
MEEERGVREGGMGRFFIASRGGHTKITIVSWAREYV